MALVKCHECGAQVSTAAKACPSCGAKPKKPGMSETSKGLLKVIAVGIAVMIGYQQIRLAMMSPEERTAYDHEVAMREAKKETERAQEVVQRRVSTCEDGIGAYTMAKSFVAEALKAPSTAKFPSFSDVKVAYLGDCQHEIAGYVDSQNGFGAMLRTRYTARVANEYGTDRWQLVGLQFNKQ